MSQRTLTRPLLAGAAVLTALALAACGTTEAPAQSSAPDAAGEAVTVTDARGEAVEIPAGVEDVVALEWVAVEHLQTVGITPVGVADVAGYEDWAGVGAPLEGEPADVGTRIEPSIDAIAGLAPDLIVAVAGRDAGAYADLEAIAPVLVLQGADASAPIETMYDDLRLVAEAVGAEDAAETAIADYEAHVEELAGAVEEAGLTGTPVAQLDGYENGGQVEIRPYADGALLPAAFESIGFVNGWPGEGDPQYGLGVTDVEGLTALDDEAHIVYMTVGDRDVFTQQLASNAIWNELPSVQAGKVHRLPDGIWLFGGVHSLTAYLDALVEALAPTP
ncbi:ABC transporter substrate-binding protein [Agrococcus carbonis]|uniref:Iron complex transport system substrate-binding protein n=1 Tax=Agrococcus carbonis TaxID=684552 RepID=A0A1H1T511_9MICO|nr:iron-siderophore ABC transporter substrate-binding protein [Agrococcus carbonis]SDS55307.1 iron complex transport system substrate-binding protein [Agrococcus carbonis]